MSDLIGIIPSITGKIELVYEGEQEGPSQVAFNLLRTQLAFIFPNPDALKKRKIKKAAAERILTKPLPLVWCR